MANLAAFRTRIQNSLDDITDKYSDAVIDEALRKVLNEYTRANPNFKTHEHTVSATGRVQTLSASALIAITKLVHPYNDALADPFAYQREDFILQFVDGVPADLLPGLRHAILKPSSDHFPILLSVHSARSARFRHSL